MRSGRLNRTRKEPRGIRNLLLPHRGKFLKLIARQLLKLIARQLLQSFPQFRRRYSDRLRNLGLDLGLKHSLHICLLSLLTSLVLLPSCQEKVDWDLEYENELRLVVEGKITNERRAHEVKLSLPVYEINGTPRPVSGAEVYISDGDTVITLREDPERRGVYLTPGDMQGVVNKTYMLQVRVNDFECTALARMVGVTPIRFPTTYLVRQNPPLYELRFTGSDAPAMMKLEMDWSHLPGYDTLSDEQNHAVLYGFFFDALTVDVNALFSPPQDRVFFPPGTRVLLTKESLSSGYAEFLRGMLSETAWNGGLFDVKPGDPFTNLSRGAIGYFAATSVLRDTVVFNP